MSKNDSSPLSEKKPFYIIPDLFYNSPYKGVAAQIPGVIDPARYDEGGQDVAYSDGSKGNMHGKKAQWRVDEDVDCHPGVVGGVGGDEWLNYTFSRDSPVRK